MTKPKVAMSLMAHPDDCEMLAGGTLAHLAARDWEIHLVTMTPGDGGSVELGPESIAAVRRQEGAASAAVIGATYHCLESRDLYVMFDEDTIRRANSLMRAINPSLVLTHSLDCYMMDHEVTARISRSATFGFSVPNTSSGPVGEGAAVPHFYYADAVEGIDAYGRPVQPTTLVDITDTMDTKTNMLKEHASQREWLMKHHGMDHYVETMQDWSAQRGKQVGVKYAEGFRQHKGHPYPRDCVLEQELGTLVTLLT